MRRRGSASERTGRWLRATGLSSIALALMAASLSWGTLCLGEDGHVVLEVAADGQCFGDAARPRIPPDTAIALRADAAFACCGLCTDLTEPSPQCVSRDGSNGLDPGPALATVRDAGSVSPLSIAVHRSSSPFGSGSARRSASPVLRC